MLISEPGANDVLTINKAISYNLLTTYCSKLCDMHQKLACTPWKLSGEHP